MTSPEAPDKLSIVVYDHHFDKVHYALVMAAAAAAIGKPVTLFFTMGACRALLANPPAEAPAWSQMPLSDGPGTGGERDQLYRDKGVAGFEELISACAALEAVFMVCEMGLQATGMKDLKLRDDLNIEISGVVTFLNDASKDGAVFTI
ncbi:MAG: DsrE/DsrF/DrsH-like family protein [Rhodospirillales bacterium]|nr:DsrE/DsrF/DrsH-like family protein [Rhodospirillales bacterium]